VLLWFEDLVREMVNAELTALKTLRSGITRRFAARG